FQETGLLTPLTDRSGNRLRHVRLTSSRRTEQQYRPRLLQHPWIPDNLLPPSSNRRVEYPLHRLAQTQKLFFEPNDILVENLRRFLNLILQQRPLSQPVDYI